MSEQRLTLAEYVKVARESRGLTLRELESRSKVSFSQISKIERGIITAPSQSILEGLSRGLNLPYETLDRLARGLPPEPGPLQRLIDSERAAGRILDPDIQDMARRIQSSPKRDYYLRVIQELLGPAEEQ